MPKKKNILKPIERAIIKAISKKIGPVSAADIVEDVKEPYQKVSRYFKKLAEQDIILADDESSKDIKKKATKYRAKTIRYMLNEKLIFGGPRCVRCGKVLTKSEHIICNECQSHMPFVEK